MIYNKIKALHFKAGVIPRSFEPSGLTELYKTVSQRPDVSYNGQPKFDEKGYMYDQLIPLEYFRVNGFQVMFDGVYGYNLSDIGLPLQVQAEIMSMFDGEFLLTVYATPNIMRTTNDGRLLTPAVRYLEHFPNGNFDIVMDTPMGHMTYMMSEVGVGVENPYGEVFEDPEWFDVSLNNVLRFTVPPSQFVEARSYACPTDFVITFTMTFFKDGQPSEHYFIPSDDFVVAMLNRYNTF